MAIRTNCVTWFRTEYTGSVVADYGKGEGNETDVSRSMSIYMTEPSKTFFDAVVKVYGRDDNYPFTQFPGYLLYYNFSQVKNRHAQSVGGTNVDGFSNFANYTIAYGQTGDPYSIMGVFQRSSGAGGETGLNHLTTLTNSGSQPLYWTARADPQSATINRGISHKLSLAYSFDDSAVTRRTKTVNVPINSLVGSAILGPTLQRLDTIGSIPALDTFLPEASKLYSDIVLEFYGFTSGNGTADMQLLYNVDAGTTYSSSLYRNAGNGGVFAYDTWRLYTSSLDTSATHSINVGSTVATTFSNLGAVLSVTYTYDEASTTRVMNSLTLHGTSDGGTMQTSTTPHVYSRQILISEPGTITLAQSGYLLFAGCAVTQTVSVKCGQQNYVGYRLLQGSVNSGNHAIVHRIDSASTGSAALNLKRGWNNLDFYSYASVENVVGGLSGMLYLNYTSDKSSFGTSAHARTLIMTMTGSTQTTQNLSFLWPNSSFIPESNYYILDAFPAVYRFIIIANEVIQILGYYTGSEGRTQSGRGYDVVGTNVFRNDAEAGTRIMTVPMAQLINPYPQNNPKSSSFNIQATRRYTFQNIGFGVHSAEMYVTYHSMTYQITGSILNYSGNGSMPIRIYDLAKNEMVIQSTSSVGGNINEYWYEDINNLQIVAYNTSSYATSDVKPAGSGSFTINFASSSAASPVEHSYTFIG